MKLLPVVRALLAIIMSFFLRVATSCLRSFGSMLDADGHEPCYLSHDLCMTYVPCRYVMRNNLMSLRSREGRERKNDDLLA
jgi:hypothetical protein